MNKDKRQLYACFLHGQGNLKEVFHASLIERKGLDLVIGTSRRLQRGHKLYLAPVPAGWDGEYITSDEVRENDGMIIANIARAEGRGRYRLACMSEQDQKQYLSIRSGFINDEEFQLDTSAEDGVITIRISGRIGFGSAGKVKAVLMRNMREKMPIVMDMRETKELSSLGLSTLTAILNDLRKSKCHFGLLVDPQSQIMKTLTQTRIGEIVKTYSNRELAVTVLKRLAGVE